MVSGRPAPAALRPFAALLQNVVVKLILLPGLDGTGVLFEPFVRELQVSSLVVRLPVELSSYDQLCDFVRPLLPTDEDFILLGESFSGPLAVGLAAEFPKRLRGVVLCATFIQNPGYFPKRLAFAVQPFLFRFFSMFSRTKTLLGGYSTPYLQQLLRQAHADAPPSLLAARVRSVLEVDVSGELAACTVPILYLQGMRDLVVPAHNLEQLRRLVPSMEWRTIVAPHLVLQTAPKEAARAIETWIARLH